MGKHILVINFWGVIFLACEKGVEWCNYIYVSNCKIDIRHHTYYIQSIKKNRQIVVSDHLPKCC